MKYQRKSRNKLPDENPYNLQISVASNLCEFLYSGRCRLDLQSLRLDVHVPARVCWKLSGREQHWFLQLRERWIDGSRCRHRVISLWKLGNRSSGMNGSVRPHDVPFSRSTEFHSVTIVPVLSAVARGSGVSHGWSAVLRRQIGLRETVSTVSSGKLVGWRRRWTRVVIPGWNVKVVWHSLVIVA